MRHQVTELDTAAALGSGDVPVLATPRLLAWLEEATVQAAAAHLQSGQTTVGTAVRIDHRRATPIGGSVETTAILDTATAGGTLTFTVRAIDTSGHIVAAGEIDRAIVDRDRFLAAATTAGPDR